MEVTNQNVAASRAAYQAARALVMVQRSALFQTITGSASGQHSVAFSGGAASSLGTGGTVTTSGSRF